MCENCILTEYLQCYSLDLILELCVKEGVVKNMNLLFPYSQRSPIDISSERCIYVIKTFNEVNENFCLEYIVVGSSEISSHFLYLIPSA